MIVNDGGVLRGPLLGRSKNLNWTALYFHLDPQYYLQYLQLCFDAGGLSKLLVSEAALDQHHHHHHQQRPMRVDVAERTLSVTQN